MKKILVIGPAGAGKSYFARRLGEITQIPVHHLDNLFWRDNRTHIPREEFDEKLKEVLKSERWIIDGDYSRTYEVRMKACDTIFFLDYPLELCLEGARSRIGQPRPDLPWVEDCFDPEFQDWIRNWFQTTLPALRTLLDKYRTTKTIHTFTSRDEADVYLSNLSATACSVSN